MAGGVEFGQANQFIHIWACKSMDHGRAVRGQARKAGVWPPPRGRRAARADQQNHVARGLLAAPIGDRVASGGPRRLP